jgi:hypothetical protein
MRYSCPKCKKRKRATAFYQRDRAEVKGYPGDLLFVVCIECKRATRTEAQIWNTVAGAQRYSRYGLDEEAYNTLITKQKNLCALCSSPPTEGKRLAIDHDHKTGRVRGLLCTSCNIALGHVEARSKRGLFMYLMKILDYVKDPVMQPL